MKFKGTKKWKVSKYERDSSGRSCYRIDETIKATDIQLKANARLIDAAPELLEALQKCLSDLKNGCISPASENRISEVQKAIEKALK